MITEELIGDFLNRRDFFIKILEKDGVIASQNVDLYFKYKDLEFEKSDVIQKYIDVFKKFYQEATIEERYLLNNFIFILEVLNLNAKQGVKEYIQRALSFKLMDNLHNSEIKVFFDFIKHEEFDSGIVIEILNNFSDLNYFLSMDNDSATVIVHNILTILDLSCLENFDGWRGFKDISFSIIKKLKNVDCLDKQMLFYELSKRVFELSTKGDNSQFLWSEFDDTVVDAFSECCSNYGNTTSKKGEADISTIGFMVNLKADNFSFLPIYMAIHSLKKSGFNIKIFVLNFVYKSNKEQEVVEEFEKLGIKCITLNDLIEQESEYVSYKLIATKVKKTIKGFLINRLIATDINAITNYIFSTKSSNIQIFWSFGQPLNSVKNIDISVTHLKNSLFNNWAKIDVSLYRGLLCQIEEREKGKIIRESIKNKFGKNSILIGTIGRIEIESRYLKVIAQILNENNNACYLAYGVQNGDEVMKKLDSFGVDKGKFFILGDANKYIFSWVIDIWPDNFCKKEQNYNCDLFLLRGGIGVYLKNRVSLTIQESYGENLRVVNNLKEYADNINRLITDKKYRNKLRDRSKNLYENGLSDFKNLIKEID